MDAVAPNPTWIVHEIIARAKSAPVLIVGGGLTGSAVGTLLLSAGVEIAIVDESEILQARREALAGARFFDNVRLTEPAEYERLKEEFFKAGFAFAVVSPGISPRSKLVQLIESTGTTLLSELDFAFAFLGYPQVIVTGTNGKSTVVELIAAMLRASSIDARAVGNIGVPMSSLVSTEALRHSLEGEVRDVESRCCYVAELSSYQLEWLRLEWCRASGGQVAVFLNITDDHLERHGDMTGYLKAKGRLFALQSEQDYAVINKDDPHAQFFISLAQGEFVPFGNGHLSPKLNNCCYIYESDNLIELCIDREVYKFSTNCWMAPGYHNLENLAASITAAFLAGAKPAGLTKAFEEFQMLPHRLEAVRTFKGVRYVDDSKGTNVSAVVVALAAMSKTLSAGAKTILLLGGAMKEGNWAPVAAALEHVGTIVYFGKDGPAVRAGLAAGRKVNEITVATLTDAVTKAADIARPGDVVLLSPGCASFDAYKNFSERGQHFKSIVEALCDCRDEQLRLTDEHAKYSSCSKK